ncbi:HNH endonuclease [Corynebacterium mendelii]|uniref:HNH endonuclease n=1 Tax=Corynebacterium mendelii TaxID=2765362 RepID=A0A939E193_9CORY|nr:HNH endonuclease signature motif containing protein [Corynebacterium mendelii]MBN9644848.1 HNH endonuclease [Corynebacterium mendelii]
MPNGKKFIDNVVAMNDNEVLRTLQESMHCYAHYECRAIVTMGVMAVRHAHKRIGCSDLADYLMSAFDRSRNWAYRAMSIGRYLLEHELICVNYLDGKFTTAHVEQMKLHDGALSDAEFCTLASRLTVTGMKEELTGIDPINKPKPDHRYFLKTSTNKQTGVMTIHARLDPMTAMKLNALLKMAEIEAGQAQKILHEALQTGDLAQALDDNTNHAHPLAETIDHDKLTTTATAIVNAIETTPVTDTTANTSGDTTVQASSGKKPRAAVMCVGTSADADADAAAGGFVDGGEVVRLKRLVRKVCEQTMLASVVTRHVSRFGQPSQANTLPAFAHLLDVALTGKGFSSRTKHAPGAQMAVTVRADGRVHTHGTDLRPADRMHMLINSNYRTLETDGTKPGDLYLGRTQRTASDRQIEVLNYFYGGKCAVPYCPNRSFLQIHHIFEWQRGGLTDIDNLIPVCETCHQKLTNHTMLITVPRTNPKVLLFHTTGINTFIATDRCTPEKYDRPASTWGLDHKGLLVESAVFPEHTTDGFAYAPIGRDVLVTQGFYTPAKLSRRRTAHILGEATKDYLGIDDDSDYPDTATTPGGMQLMALARDKTGGYLYTMDIEKEFTPAGQAFAYHRLPLSARCLISAIKDLRNTRPTTIHGIRVPEIAHLSYRASEKALGHTPGILSGLKHHQTTTRKPQKHLPHATLIVDTIDEIIDYANTPETLNCAPADDGIYTADEIADGTWIYTCGYATDTDNGTTIDPLDADTQPGVALGHPTEIINILLASNYRTRPMKGHGRYTRPLGDNDNTPIPTPEGIALASNYPLPLVPSTIYAPALARNLGFDVTDGIGHIIRLAKLMRLAHTIGYKSNTIKTLDTIDHDTLTVPGYTEVICDSLAIEIIDYVTDQLAHKPNREHLINALRTPTNMWRTDPLELVGTAAEKNRNKHHIHELLANHRTHNHNGNGGDDDNQTQPGHPALRIGPVTTDEPHPHSRHR